MDRVVFARAISLAWPSIIALVLGCRITSGDGKSSLGEGRRGMCCQTPRPFGPFDGALAAFPLPVFSQIEILPGEKMPLGTTLTLQCSHAWIDYRKLRNESTTTHADLLGEAQEEAVPRSHRLPVDRRSDSQSVCTGPGTAGAQPQSGHSFVSR